MYMYTVFLQRFIYKICGHIRHMYIQFWPTFNTSKWEGTNKRWMAYIRKSASWPECAAIHFLAATYALAACKRKQKQNKETRPILASIS